MPVINSLSKLSFYLLLTIFIASCGGDGGGGGSASGGGSNTPTDNNVTSVSGAIKLSSIIGAVKPSKSSNKGISAGAGAAIAGATVDMFDADRIDFDKPVAVATTSADGSYILNAISNVNTGSGHTISDPIPSGNYTIIAYKFVSDTATLLVAVQPFVKLFAGPIVGNDLVAQDSEEVPAVTSMLGEVALNDQGEYGGDFFGIAQNSALQITFSVAMARANLINALSVKDSEGTLVGGSWQVSPDLQTVTFYPTSQNSFTVDNIYTINLTTNATNLFNTGLPEEITGKFRITSVDTTPPNAQFDEPGIFQNVSINTKLQIRSNELLDVNTFTVSSSPSIGDKPAVIYRGLGDNSSFPFLYEIIPNTVFAQDTDYAVTVSNAEDTAGNALPSTIINFRTTSQSDETAPTITHNPSEATYDNPIAVVLTANETSTIYFTLDGSDPDTNSSIYNGPIAISETTTVKFSAVDVFDNVSSTETVTYTIVPPVASDVTAPMSSASLPSGSYNGNLNVILSANEAATIYYTTDGSNPTIDSTEYSDAIVLDQTSSLNFFAIDSAGNVETVNSETYTISLTTNCVLGSGALDNCQLE